MNDEKQVRKRLYQPDRYIHRTIIIYSKFSWPIANNIRNIIQTQKLNTKQKTKREKGLMHIFLIPCIGFILVNRLAIQKDSSQ